MLALGAVFTNKLQRIINHTKEAIQPLFFALKITSAI